MKKTALDLFFMYKQISGFLQGTSKNLTEVFRGSHNQIKSCRKRRNP